MAKISEATKLYVPAERVWDTIGRFADIAGWHPLVRGADSGGSDSRPERRLDLVDGERLVERLESHDDSVMTYSYSFREGPLPVCELTAELRVHPDDATSCTIHWSAELEPDANSSRDQAVQEVQAFFRRGLEHLRFTLAG